MYPTQVDQNVAAIKNYCIIYSRYLLFEIKSKLDKPDHQSTGVEAPTNILVKSEIKFPIENEDTLILFENFLSNSENYSALVNILTFYNSLHIFIYFFF